MNFLKSLNLGFNLSNSCIWISPFNKDFFFAKLGDGDVHYITKIK